MHWWQGAFTSTSTKPQSEDESVIAAGDGASAKSGFFSSRRNRLITRARKLRQVAENEVDNWRSLGHFQIAAARVGSPSSASLSPQPLPLPELRVLLQRDPKFASSPSSSCCSVPLPSPGDIPNTRGCGDDNERERDREKEMMEATNAEAIDGMNGLKRLAGQDARTNSEHSEMQPSRESLQMQYTKDHSSENYNISMTNSAPATPHSSHELSPRNSDTPATQYRTHPGVFQTWSAPDPMPHSDGNLNLGFSYQEKSASIVDCLTSFPSPSNSQATVHPLPLPPMASQLNSISSPGPSTPSQSTSICSHTPKPEYPGASITAQLSPISPAESIQELVPRKSQWQKGKLIGRGTFGSVYVASNRETGALCAMKEVDILPDDSKSAECMRQLEQEIKVLSHLKHPNIVQYYGSEIVGDKFYIYLEYVHPGSINKFIQDHCGAITESVVRNFTRHILCGLAYLHSKKTIHRDIKGDNLLVDAYGVVKLADFGMAKHLNGQTANLSLKGSPYWMAPELMQSAMQADASSDTALAVDIWSLGCTIVEMMDGKPPFSEYEGAAALFKVLKETPPIPETLSAEGKDFLQCCFRRNPTERPTASKLLDHPFLSQSHQHEASTQSLTETKFMDNTPLLRERPRNKLELPLPLGTQMKKGNSSNNDNNQRSHLQAAHLAATLPSPRSILEALPTLPSPERCLEKNINSSNIVLSSLKHAANI